jgi:glycosyltransferase involved in cell wall biosynthesis
LQLTSQVTAISIATKKALVKHEFIPSKKIHVVYNGISPLTPVSDTTPIKANYGVPYESFIFGTVARLDPIKNQKMLINAFADVVKSRKNVFLFIVGDGEMRGDLEKLTSSLNLESNVIFTGYRSNPSDLINMFDVFLLSSLSEGTSMTLLEAMSLSKPCVVTNAGGNPEVIEHEYNGIVCANDDQDAFSCACLNMLNKDINEMSKNSFQRFNEKFSVESMLSQYKKIWKSIK